jgi:hypothetical protein
MRLCKYLLALIERGSVRCTGAAPRRDARDRQRMREWCTAMGADGVASGYLPADTVWVGL